MRPRSSNYLLEYAVTLFEDVPVDCQVLKADGHEPSDWEPPLGRQQSSLLTRGYRFRFGLYESKAQNSASGILPV